MGAMILLVLLAHKINRMFVMYFSIVLRNAACASRVRASASLIMTTASSACFTYTSASIRSPLKRCLALRSTC